MRQSFRKVFRIPAAKVYAYYDDAWWVSKLGLMEGYVTNAKSKIPLQGRYHDGPLKCVVGHTPVGDPVYSGKKIPFGNCSGALEVYYNFGSAFFQRFMTDTRKPLSVLTNHSEQGAKLIDDLHSSLMQHHGSAFRQRGIDPANISYPSLVVMANWRTDAPLAPSCGSFWGSDKDEAGIRSPVPFYDIYVADVDYGDSGCWAVGSLIAAEKVLQADFGLSRPSWLQMAWYDSNILAGRTGLDLVV